jgi:hypothetical protein
MQAVAEELRSPAAKPSAPARHEARRARRRVCAD